MLPHGVVGKEGIKARRAETTIDGYFLNVPAVTAGNIDIRIHNRATTGEAPSCVGLPCSEYVPAPSSIGYEAREEEREQGYHGGELHNGNKNGECSGKDGGG